MILRLSRQNQILQDGTSVNEDKGKERAEDDKNEMTEKYTEEL